MPSRPVLGLALVAGLVGCAEPSDLAPADASAPADVAANVLEEAAGPQPDGQWITLPEIHAVLLREEVSRSDRETPGARVGTVLVVSGSGNFWDADQNLYQVRDFSADTVVTEELYFDAFCAGITVLPNGNPFVAGGTIWDPILAGLNDVSVYDTRAGDFVAQPPMEHGRWYPTTTLLPDGRVMVDTGWDENGNMNNTVEIYTPGVGWSPEYPMGWDAPFYLRKHVMPDGRVFMSGPETDTKMFDPAVVSENNTGWTHHRNTEYGNAPDQYWREYGTSVMLQLTPENGYEPTVMIMGGNREHPTATTETIRPMDPTSDWQWGPEMVAPRVRMSAVLLPDGKVLALGGSTVDYDTDYAVLEAELYDPATNAFSTAGFMSFPRMDHSVALLLPDATVWVAGNQLPAPDFEEHMEVYRPPYLFAADGTLAPRPVIDDAPKVATWGEPFRVVTGEAADIERVVLMRPGAVTHMFDSDQRGIGLDFDRGNGKLRVYGPPDENVAPPGWYMLFLIDADGVPSVATFIRIR
jgi:hypothetical protein